MSRLLESQPPNDLNKSTLIDQITGFIKERSTQTSTNCYQFINPIPGDWSIRSVARVTA